jgi:regulatory GntR family protein
MVYAIVSRSFELCQPESVCKIIGLHAICLDCFAPTQYLLEENSALMQKPAPPKNATETEETEKAPFLVVKRIREAILDEVFKPGEHLGELELAEKFEVSRSPVREALVALEKEGCDRKTFVRSRSLGHCGTQAGPHLSGPQTGAPSPLAGRP